METTKTGTKHIGNHQVRCTVMSSYQGWSDTRAKYAKSEEKPPSEVMPIQHTVVLDYGGRTMEELEMKNSKSDIITLRGTFNRAFDGPNGAEDFRTFLEGEGNVIHIHTRDVGSTSEIKSDEQQKREDLRSAGNLSNEDLMAILAERQEEKLAVMEGFTIDEIEEAIKEAS